ncbi:MAG: T9SS type A sorting domain-containing protein, partial [candidate division Zixibacteria bacterium]|nr:T9SS type A sorting domain-containing protein [candidate division Zixibacteria bacterium]
FTSLNSIGATWFRATGASEEKIDEMRSKAQSNLNRQIADMNNYFVLTLPGGSDIEDWINRLNTLMDVEIAEPIPLPAPTTTPGNYQSLQGYLNAATDGINANWAWTQNGGTGNNVTVCDLEYSWNLNHNDLPNVVMWVPQSYSWSDPFNDENHGTAVLGELVSLNDGIGTTGAAYGATARVVPVYLNNTWLVDVAVQHATSQLNTGDVILIEQQTWGPYGNYCPVEWVQSVYNAIVTAVGNGIHVVEAAGNGGDNLDDIAYQSGHAPFVPQNNSGAIIVGAGAAPAGFGGSDIDRSRLGFSCYGSRLNLQGWGEAVMTTGYGSYYSGDGYDYYYTSAFSGTSSASPIVASAAILYESIIEAQTTNPVTPADLRTALVSTGSPQQAGTYPISQHIGPRPDLMAAVNNSPGGSCSVNFDGVPQTYWHHDGNQNLGSYYTGVTFGPHVTILETTVYGYNDTGYPPHSGDAVAWATDSFHIRADFTNTTDHVGVWYTCGQGTFYLEAYDNGGNLLTSVTGPYNYGANDYLQVNSPGIAYVLMHNSQHFFTIDDFEWNCDTLCCCDIDMVPDNPPITVPPGGSFSFTGTIHNPCNDPITTDVWGGVIYNNQFYQQFAFDNISLNPNQTLTSNSNQYVPLFAPPGQYTYIAYCGDHPPWIVCDSAHFQFTVSGAAIAQGANEWILESGWGGNSKHETSTGLPAETILLPAYPNPFNATTTLTYQLVQSGQVNFDVYNLTGQKVAALVDAFKEAGEHHVQWNASQHSSGIYFYRLEAGNQVFTGRMTLLK